MPERGAERTREDAAVRLRVVLRGALAEDLRGVPADERTKELLFLAEVGRRVLKHLLDGVTGVSVKLVGRSGEATSDGKTAVDRSTHESPSARASGSVDAPWMDDVGFGFMPRTHGGSSDHGDGHGDE